MKKAFTFTLPLVIGIYTSLHPEAAVNLCRTEFIPSLSESKDAGNGMNSVLQLSKEPRLLKTHSLEGIRAISRWSRSVAADGRFFAAALCADVRWMKP